MAAVTLLDLPNEILEYICIEHLQLLQHICKFSMAAKTLYDILYVPRMHLFKLQCTYGRINAAINSTERYLIVGNTFIRIELNVSGKSFIYYNCTKYRNGYDLITRINVIRKRYNTSGYFYMDIPDNRYKTIEMLINEIKSDKNIK